MDNVRKKVLYALIIMALVSPVGVILPKLFNAEEAWGEWSAETIQKMIGFIPEGMKKDSEIWKAPVTDYNFGTDESHIGVQIGSYIISAAIGIALLLLIFFLFSRFYKKNEK